MRSLIVEDDFNSRIVLKYFLEEYGNCDIAVNGSEASEAFKMALASKKPYDLICLDINLPDKNGHQILNELRLMEKEMGVTSVNAVKVFMTTAMEDVKNVFEAFYGLCTEYLTKPIGKEKLVEKLKGHGLIK